MKNRSGFTVAELSLAVSLSGLVFLTLGAIWFFVWKTFVNNDREAELYEEVMLVATQVEKDMSFVALGSRVREPTGVITTSGSSFSLPMDTDNDYIPDSRVSYRVLNQGLVRNGSVISEKVTGLRASLYPTGATAGDSFILILDLTFTYDKSGEAGIIGSSSNPQLRLHFAFPAKQVSVG